MLDVQHSHAINDGKLVFKTSFTLHTPLVSDSSEQESPDPLFALAKQFSFLTQTPLRRKIAAKLDQILGLASLSDMIASIPKGHRNPYQSAHQYLKVTIDGVDDFFSQIPQTGPTLVVANHPYGALDPLILSDLALQARPDTLVFGNTVLTHPIQEEWFLPLEIIDESPAARRLNLDSMRRALNHLKAGGCIVIFPAGEVERWRWPRLRVEEGEWTTHLARLAQKSNASILPVAFPGENPLWFHLPGALHPTLRLLALPHASLSFKGKNIPIRTGPPLHTKNLSSEPKTFTETVRKAVLELAGRND